MACRLRNEDHDPSECGYLAAALESGEDVEQVEGGEDEYPNHAAESQRAGTFSHS
jgi:hypothetical protein